MPPTNAPYAPPEPVADALHDVTKSAAPENEQAAIEEAKPRLRLPANALLVLALPNLSLDLLGMVGIVLVLSESTGSRIAEPGWPELFVLAIAATMHGFESYAAAKISSLACRSLAYAGAVLASVPCMSPFLFFGVPFAIWLIVLLDQPAIKQAYQLAKSQSSLRKQATGSARSEITESGCNHLPLLPEQATVAPSLAPP